MRNGVHDARDIKRVTHIGHAGVRGGAFSCRSVHRRRRLACHHFLKAPCGQPPQHGDVTKKLPHRHGRASHHVRAGIDVGHDAHCAPTRARVPILK